MRTGAGFSATEAYIRAADLYGMPAKGMVLPCLFDEPRLRGPVVWV